MVFPNILEIFFLITKLFYILLPLSGTVVVNLQYAHCSRHTEPPLLVHEPTQYLNESLTSFQHANITLIVQNLAQMQNYLHLSIKSVLIIESPFKTNNIKL